MSCRVCRYIEMDNLAPMIDKDHQNIQNLKSHRWHYEEIDGNHVLRVIVQKRFPRR